MGYKLEIGDTVLGTQYSYGMPCSRWAVGVFIGCDVLTSPVRHLVRIGNHPYPSSFRRIEKITEEEMMFFEKNRKMIAESDKSLWWWLYEKVRKDKTMLDKSQYGHPDHEEYLEQKAEWIESQMDKAYEDPNDPRVQLAIEELIDENSIGEGLFELVEKLATTGSQEEIIAAGDAIYDLVYAKVEKLVGEEADAGEEL